MRDLPSSQAANSNPASDAESERLSLARGRIGRGSETVGPVNQTDRLRTDLAESRQREQAALDRAEILARANRVMHDSLGAIGDSAELEHLLGQVLSTIARQLGEAWGGVWLYDADRDLLRLYLDLKDGRAVPLSGTDHPGAGLGDESQAKPAGGYQNLLYRANQALQFGPDILYGEPDWAPYRDYFRALGVRCVLSIPLFAGESFLGCITVRALHHDSFPPEDVAFAQALANQASLALHCSRLAEQAHEAAVATARAAELARANDALREGLAFFAGGADIDGFLRHQLKVIADQFGSISAGLWVDGPEPDATRLVLSLEDGQVVDAAHSRHPLARTVQSQYGGNDLGGAFRRERKPLLWPSQIYRDPAMPFFNPALADALEAGGTRAVLMLPLVVGDAVIGAFSHRLPTADPIPAAKLELAQALANQSALALHLARLAAAEREAAVALEREAAAQARAEKLAVANRLLRESAERLGSVEDIDAFLGETLKVTAEQLGAASATLWQHEGLAGLAFLKFLYADGRVVAAEHSDHPNARAPSPIVSWSADVLVDQMPRYTGTDLLATDEQRRYFMEQGVRGIISVPLVIHGIAKGSISARILVGEPDPTPDQLELAMALANQAAVALHLTALAEKAREAAVAREREEAAQARVEKLAAANRLLRESAERLGSVEDIDAFLGAVLLTMTQLLDGHSSTVWSIDEQAGVTRLRHVVENGLPVPAEDSGHPFASQPRPILVNAGEFMPGHGTAQATPHQFVIAELSAITEVERAYFADLGVRSLVSIPMVLGGAHFGTFTIRLVDKRPLVDDELELIQALANQAAVALHLTLLAEQARDAAVAREREAAAEARAKKLAAANQLLRESAERLGAVEDIDAFLGQVLLTISQLLGASSATVWTEDTAAGVARLRFVVEDGIALPASRSSHPNAHAPASIPVRDDPMPNRGTPIAESAIVPVDELLVPEPTKDHLRGLGVKALLAVPMVLGERHLGHFTVRLVGEAPILDDDLELIRALANQAAVALHLTLLAEQVRDAAIAQERQVAAERRAEALARANAAIRTSLDRLAEGRDLKAFLGEVVTVCAREFDAIGVGVWVRPGDEYVNDLVVSYEDGEIRYPGRFANPAVRNPDSPSHAPLQRGEVLIETGDALKSQSWYPLYRNYLESRGIVAIASVPLFIGDRWHGAIVLRFTREPAFDGETGELAHALANQVALALELTRLADQARETAIAREREAAAQARAEKLAVAGRLLRESAERLGAVEDIDRFLGQVLLTITELLDAKTASLWIADSAGETARVTQVVQDGAVVPADRSDHPDAGQSFSFPAPSCLMAGRTAPNAFVHVSSVTEDPDIEEVHRAYFRKLGVRTLLKAPMVWKGRRLGSFTVRLTDDSPPLDDDKELIQALVNQAAVALHLARLAESGREMAVAQEREAAAKARAEKIAAANRLLRDRVGDIDVFLGQVLLTINDLLGGHSSTLWTQDYDVGESRLRFVVEDGRVVPAARSLHPNALAPAKIADDADRIMPGHGTADAKPYQSRIADNPGFTDAQRAYLEGLGVKSMLSVPIVLDQVQLGVFTVRLTDDRPVLEEDSELIQTLANQAAVAMHLTRSADAAREAAVLREREAAAIARAATLDRISEAGRASLQRLAGQPELDAFLGEILRVCAEQFAAVGGGVWLFSPRGRDMRLVLTLEDGEILDGKTSRHPGTSGLASLFTGADLSRVLKRIMKATREKISHSSFEDLETEPELAPYRDFFRTHGIRTLVHIPLVLGDRVLGTLSLRFVEDRTLTVEEEGLAYSLANQAALALEFTRLAEEGRKTALIRERAAVAQERAADLARANAGLQRTLDTLATGPDLDVFLGNVLSAVTSQARASSSSLWLFDTASGLNTLHIVCWPGRGTHRADADGAPPLSVNVKDWPLWCEMVETKRPVLLDQSVRHLMLPDTAAWLDSQGITSLMIIPLALGNQMAGTIGLHRTDGGAWEMEEISLAQAMAHQATIAIELTRLSLSAEVAAVAEERNRMAREIHDTLAQGFAAIGMQLQAAERLLDGPISEPAARSLATARDLARSNLMEARRSVGALKLNGDSSLAAELQQLLDSVRRTGDTPVAFAAKSPGHAPAEVIHEFVRIAQEALNNALGHGKPTHVTVELSEFADAGIRLSIEDDGKGFDTSVPSLGFGLTGMRERAESISAALTVISEPGAGTQVVASWHPEHLVLKMAPN